MDNRSSMPIQAFLLYIVYKCLKSIKYKNLKCFVTNRQLLNV